MALEFPKHVEIVNPRLSILYYTCMGAMCAVAITLFFVFEQHSKQVSLAGHVQVNLWPIGFVGDAAARNLLQTSLEVQKKPICQQPSDVDFWWDENWKYDNNTCISLCLPGAPEECLGILDTFIVEGPDQLFFTTHLQKTFIPKRVISSTEPQFQNYIVPTTEALGVAFVYSYDVPLDKTSNWLVQTPGPHTGSSSENILTVLVDDQGTAIRAIKPSTSSIQLMVPDLLAMSGDGDLLDSLGPHPNVKSGAKLQTGPLTRISGKTLTLEVNCYNGHRGDIEGLLDGDWDGPACYVGVRDRSKSYTWTSSERRVPGRDAAGNEGTDLLLYRGLRVVAKGDGAWKVIDFNNIYLNIVSFMVLLELPKMFILFVAVTLLGHYSKIYKGVIFEQFNMMDEVAGMATRLMSNSVAFVDLKDTSEQGGAGISSTKMRERLNETLKHRGEKLDQDEKDSFVNFCFKTVVNNRDKKEKKRRRSSLCSLSNILGCEESVTTKGETSINIDCFSKACSSLDKIRFEAVVKLFDRDRRVRPLERLFMPAYMRQYFLDVDHARAISEVDLERGLRHTCGVSHNASEHSLDLSSRHRASESSILTQFSVCEASVFDKVPRISDGSSTTASGQSQQWQYQPSMPRETSNESAELCRQLERHSAICRQIADPENLTLEQKKQLPQFLLQAMHALMTRELRTHGKLRDDKQIIEGIQGEVAGTTSFLEDIQNQVAETKQIASTHLLDEMSQMEKQVQDNTFGLEQLRCELLKQVAEHGKEIADSKSELGRLSTLAGSLVSSQQDLAHAKVATQSCKQDLAPPKEAPPLESDEASVGAIHSSSYVRALQSDAPVDTSISYLPACFFRNGHKRGNSRTPRNPN